MQAGTACPAWSNRLTPNTLIRQTRRILAPISQRSWLEVVPPHLLTWLVAAELGTQAKLWDMQQQYRHIIYQLTCSAAYRSLPTYKLISRRKPHELFQPTEVPRCPTAMNEDALQHRNLGFTINGTARIGVRMSICLVLRSVS